MKKKVVNLTNEIIQEMTDDMLQERLEMLCIKITICGAQCSTHTGGCNKVCAKDSCGGQNVCVKDICSRCSGHVDCRKMMPM